MTNCEKLATCPFFNDKLENMPSMSKIYKKKYCQSDSSSCARYMVSKALGKEKVPPNLFPNQEEIAKQIMKYA